MFVAPTMISTATAISPVFASCQPHILIKRNIALSLDERDVTKLIYWHFKPLALAPASSALSVLSLLSMHLLQTLRFPLTKGIKLIYWHYIIDFQIILLSLALAPSHFYHYKHCALSSSLEERGLIAHGHHGAICALSNDNASPPCSTISTLFI